ncbi:AfsR/SARP family transcriptional regulator [Streptomyces cadmiisoli]|uniref:AfsR/SARP family transcriptional regulator n=1 Tax=Streptomyces cadmiisoli TaxID=2184053 RepID=UPI003D74F6AE
MTVRVSVLGGLHVEIDGRPAELGPPRRQSVLASLLVDANNVVSADRLTDRVWNGRPPNGARQALHSYLSRLRAALQPAGERMLIERRSGGYVLRLSHSPADDVTMDLHQFRELTAQARALAVNDSARAAVLLETALGLWHGSAFGSLEGDWLDEVRAHTGEERLQAEIARNDLLLSQGRQAELLVELRSRVEANPTHERLVGQLMLALHQEGRTAHALELYEHLRRELAESMGTDPAPELRRLHLEILGSPTAPVGKLIVSQDSDIQAAQARATESRERRAPGPDFPEARDEAASSPAVPSQLPLPPSSLSGRAQEQTALDAARSAGTSPITVICGMGGTGKTSLALCWAHANLEHYPDGQLYVNLRGFDPGTAPLTPQEGLRLFLSALGVDPRVIPADLEAQTGLYRSLTAGRRILVLLDNACDVEQVRPLLPGSSSCTVLITSRNRLTGLIAAEGAHLLVLEPLTPDGAARLLADRLGKQRVSGEPEAAASLIAACGRLPLALAVVCARAVGDPQLPLATLAAELDQAGTRLDALDTGDLSTSLRAVFDTSYGALLPDAARLLGLLGLAPGHDIGLPAAAALTGLPPVRARVLLRALEDAHLLRQHVPGRYSLHDLVRLYAAERGAHSGSLEVRTAALTALTGFYVEAASAARALMDPYGTSSAVAAGHAPEPTDHARQPEDSAEAARWFEAERSCLLGTATLAGTLGLHSQAWRLCWDAHLLLRRCGHVHDLLETSETGLAAALEVQGPTAERLQGLAHRAVASALLLAGRTGPETFEHLSRALLLSERTDDLLNQAHTHQGIVMALDNADQSEAALEHAARSLDLYVRAGHQLWEANAYNTLGWCQAGLGQYEAAHASCLLSLTTCRNHGFTQGEAGALDSLGHISMRAGRPGQAASYFRQALEVQRRRCDAYEEAITLSSLAEAHHALGEQTQAEAAWQQALALYVSQHRAARAEETRARLEAALAANQTTPAA